MTQLTVHERQVSGGTVWSEAGGGRVGSLERHLPTLAARVEPPIPVLRRVALGQSSTEHPMPRRSVLSVQVAICAPTVHAILPVAHLCLSIVICRFSYRYFLPGFAVARGGSAVV